MVARGPAGPATQSAARWPTAGAAPPPAPRGLGRTQQDVCLGGALGCRACWCRTRCLGAGQRRSNPQKDAAAAGGEGGSGGDRHRRLERPPARSRRGQRHVSEETRFRAQPDGPALAGHCGGHSTAPTDPTVEGMTFSATRDDGIAAFCRRPRTPRPNPSAELTRQTPFPGGGVVNERPPPPAARSPDPHTQRAPAGGPSEHRQGRSDRPCTSAPCRTPASTEELRVLPRGSHAAQGCTAGPRSA